MNTTTTITPRRVAFVALLSACVVAAVACGSSNNNPTPTGSGGGSTIVGPTSTSTTSSSSTTTSSSTSTSGSTSTSTSSSGGTGGCFSGTPTTNADFLNACNGTCNTFDPKKLPLWDGGALPALP